MPRRVRWSLALIVAAFCALGALHSVVIPLFEAPDEIWHFSFIETLARDRSLPVQSTEIKDVWLREAGQPPLYHILAALLAAPFDASDFPGFVRFNLAHPAVNPGSHSDAPNVFIHTSHEAYPYRGSVRVVHLLRLLGVLWGAGTIAGVYWVAHQILPRRDDLALTAAAVAAFNPHFIFISSVINNDVAVACLSTWVLGLCVAQVRGRTRLRTRVALGLLLGLALLSKLSALALLPLVALALGLAWWRDRDGKALIARGATVLALALVVSAWWYVRNVVLYGDPLGWSVWLQDIGTTRITFNELLRQFGHVFTSFWSAADGLYPQLVFWGLGALLAVATVGWCVLIGRYVTGRNGADAPNLLRSSAQDRGPAAAGRVLVGAWFVLLFVSLVRYMTTTPSAEGRLLFPGIASFSALLVWGWDAVLPRRWLPAAAGTAVVGLLTLSLASPLLAIAPRYALPLVDQGRPLPDMTPLDVSWGDVRLLGVQVEPDVFRSGDTVSVNLYWRAGRTTPADLAAVVRLWTAGGRLLGQWDQVPAGETYPPDLWQAGDIVRDVYPVRVQERGPAICRVMISIREGQRWLDEVETPPLCKLLPPTIAEANIPHRVEYNLGDRAVLAGYGLRVEASPAPTLAVTLYWRVVAHFDQPYTVFVHWTDAGGQILAQGDGPPLAGDYPTDRWSPGELLSDTHLVPLPEAGPDGYLLVGLYRPDNGTRLPVHAATGQRIQDDAIRIDVDRP